MSTRPCGDCGEPFADESHRCPPTTGPTSPAVVARAATPAQARSAASDLCGDAVCGTMRELREAYDREKALRAEVERLRGGIYPLTKWTPETAWAEADELGATEDSLLVQWIRCRDRAEAAEAKVAAVEALAEKWVSSRGSYADHGSVQRFAWEGAVVELRAALSGPSEPTCGADITHRDDDHRQSVCVLPASHTSAHDDGQGCRWTDADHHEPDEPVYDVGPGAFIEAVTTEATSEPQWTNLDHPNLSEGWANPTPTSKAHYFREGRSLCGRHTIEPGTRIAGVIDEWDGNDCRTCVKAASAQTAHDICTTNRRPEEDHG